MIVLSLLLLSSAAPNISMFPVNSSAPPTTTATMPMVNVNPTKSLVICGLKPLPRLLIIVDAAPPMAIYMPASTPKKNCVLVLSFVFFTPLSKVMDNISFGLKFSFSIIIPPMLILYKHKGL